MPRLLLALVLVAALVAGAFYWLRVRPGGERGTDGAPPVATQLPDLGVATGWVNGTATADSLRGHPVALVVWSDTDPRGPALLKEAEAWHQAYARFGVRVIGVHSPVFSFAADTSVAWGVARRLRLSFPIAYDPGYRILSALGAEDSPAIVVAGGDGAIALTAGADGAGRADHALRELIAASRPDLALPEGARGAPPALAATRFVYLGTTRVTGGPLVGGTPGKTQTFTTQFRFQEDGEPLVPYPVGRWTPSAEGLTAARGGPQNFVVMRVEGGSVEAVLGPPPEQASRVWVLDGDDWLAPEARGEDVRADETGATYVEVDGPRLYAIAQGGARTLKLSPDAPGVTVYGFAVGAK